MCKLGWADSKETSFNSWYVIQGDCEAHVALQVSCEIFSTFQMKLLVLCFMKVIAPAFQQHINRKDYSWNIES